MDRVIEPSMRTLEFRFQLFAICFYIPIPVKEMYIEIIIPFGIDLLGPATVSVLGNELKRLERLKHLQEYLLFFFWATKCDLRVKFA